jgi:hypothetical protein
MLLGWGASSKLLQCATGYSCSLSIHDFGIKPSNLS